MLRGLIGKVKRRLKRRNRLKGARWFHGASPGVMDGVGGTRKVVVHTEGVLRGKRGAGGNAFQLAEYVSARNIGYHFVYDYHGRWAQLYNPGEGSRAMLAGRWSPNRQGDVAIQICFAGVADASDVKDWPLTNWNRFLEFCDAWGIPRKEICDFKRPSRSEKDWRRSGWTCHAAAPMNDHVDGKGAPVGKLLGR